MDLEILKKANELDKKIKDCELEKKIFNSNNNIVILNTSDMYGNKGRVLRLYDNHVVKTDNFTTYYQEFLEKCEKDIDSQIVELQKQLDEL